MTPRGNREDFRWEWAKAEVGVSQEKKCTPRNNPCKGAPAVTKIIYLKNSKLFDLVGIKGTGRVKLGFNFPSIKKLLRN